MVGRLAAGVRRVASAAAIAVLLCAALGVGRGVAADDASLCTHTFDSAGVGFNL